MIKYIYKKLISKRLKPFILSKLNLWNFLNTKRIKLTNLAILMFFKNLSRIKINSIKVFSRNVKIPYRVVMCVWLIPSLTYTTLYINLYF